MGLTIKNVNIMEVHQFLGEGEGRSQKARYMGSCLKRRVSTICRVLTKNKQEGVFEGGGGGVDTSIHAMT